MSSGDSNMAGGVLGTTFSLLLLASIIQGFPDFKILHFEKQEALVGQNVSLPCILKKHGAPSIVSIEWQKEDREITKLGLYSPLHEQILSWPNLTIQIEENEANTVVGSYLHLPQVKKWDSAIYICIITAFPEGSHRIKTQLSVKDDSTIECNMRSNIVVRNGGNVTIDCNASLPSAIYCWTKNKNVVSKNASLELWRVTDANAGIYTLTVNMGKETLHKGFIITVLPAATSSRTELMTVSSRYRTETTVGSLATTMAITANHHNTSNATLPSEERYPSSTDPTFTTDTSTPAPSSDIGGPPNATSPGYESTEFGSTQELIGNRSESQTPHPEGIASTKPEVSSSFGNVSDLLENPSATSTPSTGNATEAAGDKVTVNKDEGTKRGHQLLALIVIPILLLIAVAGFLYRRRVVKKRMDLPPPFKPPPPPVKYTAPRRREI